MQTLVQDCVGPTINIFFRLVTRIILFRGLGKEGNWDSIFRIDLRQLLNLCAFLYLIISLAILVVQCTARLLTSPWATNLNMYTHLLVCLLSYLIHSILVRPSLAFYITNCKEYHFSMPTKSQWLKRCITLLSSPYSGSKKDCHLG